MYRLIFLNGKMKGRRVAVQQGSVVIGRDATCHLDIPDDASVALRHATIEDRDGAYFLRNLDTVVPARLNGAPVSEAALKSGDKIEVGQTQLEFYAIEKQPDIGQKRRVSSLQMVTFAIVVVVVAAQLFYVVVSPLINRLEKLDAKSLAEARKKIVKPPVATNLPPPVATTTNDPDMAKARALIDAMAAASNVPPMIEVSSSPVPVAVSAEIVPPPLVPKIIPVVPPPPPPEKVSPVSPVSPAAVPNPFNVPPRVQDETLIGQAKAMMEAAKAKIAADDLMQADQTYDRIQIMVPDFVPAYAARAKLYEKLEMFRESGAQWQEVAKRSTDAVQVMQAKTEVARLAKLEAAAKNAPPKPKIGPGANRRIRIVSVEREKFQATGEYEEMRVVHVNLRMRPGETISAMDVRVLVTFYDRDADTGKIVPSRAIVPGAALRIEGHWNPEDTKTITATYTLPKNFRRDEFRSTHRNLVYAGYRVQVFLLGEVVDEDASSNDLLELPAPKLPVIAPADLPVGR